MNESTAEIISSDSWTFPVTGERFQLVVDEDDNLRANRLLTEAESQQFYETYFDRSSSDCNHLTDWLLNRAFRLNKWGSRRLAMKCDSLFRLLATLPNEVLLNPLIFRHRQCGVELLLTIIKPAGEKDIAH